jgi:anti-sigma regulatory factor (Ser/Thr protein kinase)
MKRLSVEIEFSKISSHNDLVERFSDVFKLGTGDVVDFKLDLSGRGILYPDYLTLVCSVVIYLRESGVVVKGKLLNFRRESSKVRYASRVNFFRILGFKFEEKFKRRESKGGFLEIKKFDNKNANDLHSDIVKILIEIGVSDNILTALQYCLWELLDNTLIHSADGGAELSAGSGFVCVQHYPKNKEIRLIISDNGYGIHYALTKHPKSEFQHFTESESIFNCINKGVTNSNGRGFGLWATAKLVELNQGELIIHSGGHQLKICTETTISSAPNWKGM